MHIIFDLIFAFFSAWGIVVILILLSLAVAVFLWWLFSNFFTSKISATITGIRAYQKDTSLEDGEMVKAKPYDMYSPLLLCTLANGNVISGTLSSSQSWLPKKWQIGKKIKVLATSDPTKFSEGVSYLFLVIVLFFAFMAYGVSQVIMAFTNQYTPLALGILLLYFLYKWQRRGFLGKFFAFISNTRWNELKKDFFKRKKIEDTEKNWRKLSNEEIASIMGKRNVTLHR